MIIDERIFNDLEKVDLKTDEGRKLLDDYAVGLWDSMTSAERQAYREVNNIEIDDDYPEKDIDTFQDEINTSVTALYRVPQDSLLEKALFIFGHAKFGTNLFDTYDKLELVMIHDEAYFAAGYGYDIVSQDLLHGDGSGSTKIEFLKIVNEND